MMPGTTGPELQRKLADDGVPLPVVMISGHADVRTAVEAMTLGAVTLLEKPFALDDLLAHVRTAIEKDATDRTARGKQADARSRLAVLTPKEREVLDHIVAGRTNREVADTLGLSVRAVEDRRSRLMKRLGVNSLAELVTLAAKG